MDRRQQESVIVDLVRSFGSSLRNRKLYPPTHPLVRAPVDKCFSDLLRFFAEQPELVLVVANETLVFEGVPVFNLTSSLEQFMERLERIGVPAVIFEKEVTPAEIETFIRFLHETTEQGLSVEQIRERLAGMGVAHIRVRPHEESEGDDFRFARRIYDNAVDAVRSVLREVRSGRIPSGAEPDRVVREMGGMLRKNRDAILALTLIKNFDEYTYNHSVNVAVLSLALAEALSLPEQEKIEVGVAGLLHDVGKT
ncbi:MAG: HD-GYP domain-containing protein, partial [Gemmatimonadota bacterium]